MEAGADADATNEGGQTALELAATRGKLRSLFVLLDDDGSGAVTVAELRQLGRIVGVEPPEEAVQVDLLEVTLATAAHTPLDPWPCCSAASLPSPATVTAVTVGGLQSRIA